MGNGVSTLCSAMRVPEMGITYVLLSTGTTSREEHVMQNQGEADVLSGWQICDREAASRSDFRTTYLVHLNVEPDPTPVRLRGRSTIASRLSAM